MTGGFPSERACYAEKVFIWWHHNGSQALLWKCWNCWYIYIVVKFRSVTYTIHKMCIYHCRYNCLYLSKHVSYWCLNKSLCCHFFCERHFQMLNVSLNENDYTVFDRHFAEVYSRGSHRKYHNWFMLWLGTYQVRSITQTNVCLENVIRKISTFLVQTSIW